MPLAAKLSTIANMMTTATETRYLQTDGGRIAYDEQGSGRLMVLVPGMGELRQTYRFVVPELVAAGFRVVTTDLRGHGDSDATFAPYGDEQTASDLKALVEHLGAPAIVVGNSMAAGSAALLDADAPELVDGLVLIGPFLRDPKLNPVVTGLMRVLMARPWATAVWNAYLPSLYAGRKPADFAEYRALIRAALRKPGRAAAFTRTTRLSHAGVEARLDEVTAPALVLMGALDPDFPDAAAEAQWIASRIGADVVMVDDAGHYPQAQRPDVVAPAIIAFAERIARA